MKITNSKFLFTFLSCVSFVLSMSCGSTKLAESSEPVESPVVEERHAEETVQVDSITAEPDVSVEDDEYVRSVGSVSVSRDTFASDKEEVLRIISELDVIMNDFNYKSWVTYVDKDSIDYWKLRKNLQKAEKRLPVKGIKLRDLEDFFKHFFVPARRGKTITEIRYISDVYIKAIQVQDGQDDIVYYYFNKINGKWMVHIPPIEN